MADESARTEQVIELEGPALNTVPFGLELAERVVRSVRDGRSVVLDFGQVERVTPSFANAVVMTILQEIGVSEFAAKVRAVRTSAVVDEAWTKAVQRFERGIRLTTQRQRTFG